MSSKFWQIIDILKGFKKLLKKITYGLKWSLTAHIIEKIIVRINKKSSEYFKILPNQSQKKTEKIMK